MSILLTIGTSIMFLLCKTISAESNTTSVYSSTLKTTTPSSPNAALIAASSVLGVVLLILAVSIGVLVYLVCDMWPAKKGLPVMRYTPSYKSNTSSAINAILMGDQHI